MSQEYQDILKSYDLIKDYIAFTPLIKAHNHMNPTYLKLENFQLTNSFKVRGSFNKIFQLTTKQKEAGVITCSAGNHAQGVALASSITNIDAIVVMPVIAPRTKVEATKRYGAQVILYGENFDEAKDYAKELAIETHRTFIHPYDDYDVICGQGTIGVELARQLKQIDTIILPVGGGGLIAGVALFLKEHNPNITIIGVQSDNVHGMKASVDARKIVSHFKDTTIADGCFVKRPGMLTFSYVLEHIDSIISVSEDEILKAMNTLLMDCKVVCEGAGALAYAALLSNKIDKIYTDNKNTVIIVSGGNADNEVVSKACNNY